MDVCEILKFVAENPRIPFYQFIFLYHENMEFRVFFEKKIEIFKKFQILLFQYIKLQLEVNNVFIIFDNCAFKCQNSRKTRILDSVIYNSNYDLWNLSPFSNNVMLPRSYWLA